MKAALDAGKRERDRPVYDDSEEGDAEEDTVVVIESSSTTRKMPLGTG